MYCLLSIVFCWKIWQMITSVTKIFVCMETLPGRWYAAAHLTSLSRGRVWLGNKIPRARRCRVDLPVSLLASRVACFLHAERRGVCVRGAMWEWTESQVTAMEVWYTSSSYDPAGTGLGETTMKPLYVSASVCAHYYSHRLFMSGYWCILQQLPWPGGEKEALHVDAFV